MYEEMHEIISCLSANIMYLGQFRLVFDAANASEGQCLSLAQPLPGYIVLKWLDYDIETSLDLGFRRSMVKHLAAV